MGLWLLSGRKTYSSMVYEIGYYPLFFSGSRNNTLTEIEEDIFMPPSVREIQRSVLCT